MRATGAWVLVAAAIAGCGGGGDGKPKGLPGTPNPDVKRVAQAYLDAYTAKDPQAICSLLTQKVREQLADNKGTCEKTLSFSLRTSEEFPKLQIGDARAEGTVGRALVADSQRQITLERSGGDWKVAHGGV